MILFISLLIFAYLLGSIPTGYLITKVKKGTDIRKFGSGATGGTNVSRILGLKWGIVVAILDVLKGMIPTYFALKVLSSDWQIIIIAITTVLAHISPVWLNFKAGKGVSTLFGTLIVIFGWKIALILIICWVTMLWILRLMSLTNLIFILFLPFIFWFFSFSFPYIFFGVLSVAILWWSHRENIQRLLKEKEPKIDFHF